MTRSRKEFLLTKSFRAQTWSNIPYGIDPSGANTDRRHNANRQGQGASIKQLELISSSLHIACEKDNLIMTNSDPVILSVVVFMRNGGRDVFS